ncbi:MAG TPA: hypothetical protein VJG90_04420 [Candidatus Nanoarchaeia archaeon]|nr:hypothetical protein [Candidatus Nanoarchaeia archaeon]
MQQLTMEDLEGLIGKVDDLTQGVSVPRLIYFSLDIVLRKADGSPVVVDYNRNPWGLHRHNTVPHRIIKEESLTRSARMGKSTNQKVYTLQQYLGKRVMAQADFRKGLGVFILCDPVQFVGLVSNSHYTDSLRTLVGGIAGMGIRPYDIFVSSGRAPGSKKDLSTLRWDRFGQPRRGYKHPLMGPELSHAGLFINYGGTAYDASPTGFDGVKAIPGPQIASNVVGAKSLCHAAVEEVCKDLSLPSKSFTPDFTVSSGKVLDVEQAVASYVAEGRMALVKYDQYGNAGSVVAVSKVEDLMNRIHETKKMVVQDGVLCTNIRPAYDELHRFVVPFETVLIEEGVDKKTVPRGKGQCAFDLTPLAVHTETGTFEMASLAYRIAPYPLDATPRGWNANQTGMELGILPAGDESRFNLSARDLAYTRLAVKVAGLGLLRLAEKLEVKNENS